MTTRADAPDPRIRAELRALLDESLHDAHQREGRLVGDLRSQPDRPLVLYGAGNLGCRTASLLRSNGISVAAFIDNDEGRWGTNLEGIPILSPSEGSSRLADHGLVIVTVWRAEGGHDFRVTRDDLRKRGWSQVESFIALFWGLGVDALPYITIDLPSNVLASRDEVLGAADLWSDERSLREFVGQVRWRLTGDFAALPPPEPDQYFAAGIVSVKPDEVFVDCGAFTGDTMLDVARRVGSWRAYHAFEPDPASFEMLKASLATLPARLADSVHLHRAATADRSFTAQFNASGMGSASLSASGAYEVECIAIDQVVADPTFIKMDIEGAEAAAISGASKAIRERRPLLAIAAYHKQADLWELPKLVHDLEPAYRLFLRPHVAEGFDTVLYAVPPDRNGIG